MECVTPRNTLASGALHRRRTWTWAFSRRDIIQGIHRRGAPDLLEEMVGVLDRRRAGGLRKPPATHAPSGVRRLRPAQGSVLLAR
jgi:hypothetical protein